MNYTVNNILERDIENIDDLLLSNITSEMPLIIQGNDEEYLKNLSELYGCTYIVNAK